VLGDVGAGSGIGEAIPLCDFVPRQWGEVIPVLTNVPEELQPFLTALAYPRGGLGLVARCAVPGSPLDGDLAVVQKLGERHWVSPVAAIAAVQLLESEIGPLGANALLNETERLAVEPGRHTGVSEEVPSA